jgi:hypothetical protein
MRIKMLGYGWAQPVVSKRWAFVCSVLFAISRATGNRVLNHRKHLAWERACGIA